MTRLAAILALACASGCAVRTTRIVADDRDGLVWVDGRYTGRGVGVVHRVGPPHTARILVTLPDGRRGRALMQREVTPRTVRRGLRTFGICLAFCWEYPDEIQVTLPKPKPKSGWAVDPEKDPWLLAPGAGPSAWDEPPRWATSGSGRASPTTYPTTP